MGILSNGAPGSKKEGDDGGGAGSGDDGGDGGTANPFKADDWRHQYNDSTLSKFPEVGDMVKSYKELERAWGSQNKMVKPDKGNKEAMAAHYKEMGLPESAAGYDLGDFKLTDRNTPIVEALKLKAHELGLMPEQLTPLLKEIDIRQSEAVKVQMEGLESEREQTLEKWKAQMGTAFEPTLAAAQFAVREFVTQEQLEYFEQAGIADDPMFIEMLASIGKGMGEDAEVFKGKTKKGFGLTPEQAKLQLQDTMAEDGYGDSSHPNHRSLMDRVKKLSEIAYA